MFEWNAVTAAYNILCACLCHGCRCEGAKNPFRYVPYTTDAIISIVSIQVFSHGTCKPLPMLSFSFLRSSGQYESSVSNIYCSAIAR